jgi:hypothetical protein
VGRPTIPPEGRGGRSLSASLRLGTRKIAVGPGGVKSRSQLASTGGRGRHPRQTSGIDERKGPTIGTDQHSSSTSAVSSWLVRVSAPAARTLAGVRWA